jgi:hypothetical protein
MNFEMKKLNMYFWKKQKESRKFTQASKKNEARVYYQVKQNFELPPAYRHGLKRLEKLYLGDETNRVPFGGRTKEILALDHWLLDVNQPPYAIIAAQAGRGKSALMIVWANLVIKRNLAKVILIPINTDLETNLKSIILRTLAVILPKDQKSKPPLLGSTDQDLQAICEEQLRRIEIDEQQLLIIFDGIDEAVNWGNLEGFFPNPATPGLRILITAGFLGGSDQVWRQALGWEDESLAKSIPLPELSVKGVGEILESMGNPLAELAPQKDIVSALNTITESNPLLIRLYVDLFQERLKQGIRTTIQEIQNMDPGYDAYFEEWLKDQRSIWEKQNLDPNSEAECVWDLFYALAYALGPLYWVDLKKILPADSHLLGVIDRRSFLESLKQFIQGDGEKYALSFLHPKLKNYFLSKLMDGSALFVWEGRYLNYCRNELLRLNTHPKDNVNVSPYPIRYYGIHLDNAKRRITKEEYYELVSEGWMRAWYAFEGTYSGFLNDVERVWEYADQMHDIAMQIKCALCRASVNSLNEMVPDFLPRSITSLYLSPIQAVDIAKQIPYEYVKADALKRIFPLLNLDLQIDVLAAARAIQDERYRSYALSSLALHLPPELLQQALAAAWTIQDEDLRYETLSNLAPHLPPELLQQVLQEALAATWTTLDEDDRSYALSSLAPHPPPKLLPQQTLSITKNWTIQDEDYRSYALSSLAPYLSPELQKRVLQEALAAARAIQDEDGRFEILDDLVHHMPPELQSQVLHEALVDAWATQDEYLFSMTVSSLAPYLPSELLQDALTAARAIQFERYRSDALSSLAPHLPPELSQEALAAAWATQDEYLFSKTVSSLAPYLPPELLQQALAAVQTIQNERYRSEVLSRLAPYLPPEMLQEGLAAAREIQDEGCRSQALGNLAFHLPTGLQQQVFQEAMAATLTIQDEGSRTRTLSSLAPHLSSDLLQEALAAARAIQDQHYRSEALRNLAPHLSLELQHQVLQDALVAARAIKGVYLRFEALSSLAPHLPLELQPQVLQEALAAASTADDEESRHYALSSLIPKLLSFEEFDPDFAYSLWIDTLHALTKFTRGLLFFDIKVILPFGLMTISDKNINEVVSDIFQCIQEISKWWP